MIVQNDRADYSDDLYECVGDLFVFVMASQGDNNMCDHINTPSHTVWRAENCSSCCVPSGDTCTSLFCNSR